MTTIALRNGLLAADGRTCIGSLAVASGSKIVRGDDYVFAMSGDAALKQVLKQWLDAGCGDQLRPKITYAGGEKPQMRAIVIRRSATEPSRIAICDEDFLFVPYDAASFIAIGSGDRLAMGAMAMGATAVKAVVVACQYDTGSGLPVYWYDLTTGQEGVEHG